MSDRLVFLRISVLVMYSINRQASNWHMLFREYYQEAQTQRNPSDLLLKP